MVNQPAWDSTSEELVKTSKTVEFHLQPLLDELGSLSLNAPNQHDRGLKGRSKRAHVLVEAVCDSIEQFIRQGAEVAQENPEMRDEVMQTISTLRSHGNQMAEASKEFANDPLSSGMVFIFIYIFFMKFLFPTRWKVIEFFFKKKLNETKWLTVLVSS